MTTKKTETELQTQLLREILAALREQAKLLRDIRGAVEEQAGYVRLTG